MPRPAGFLGPRAGELRAVVKLQNRVQAPDASNSLTTTYTDIATVRAKVVAISGGLIVDGVQTEERATHRFFIRWRSDRGDWDWLEFDSRRFRVVSVRDPDERGKWMEILAEEERDV